MTEGNAGAPPDREELQELAAWARAVPEALLSDNSPNARYFNRIATILESLSPAPVERREAIARAAWNDIEGYLDAECNLGSCGSLSDADRSNCVNVIKSAILALTCPDEAAIREKCAKIAEAHVQQYHNLTAKEQAGSETAQAIAHAIRNKGDAL